MFVGFINLFVPGATAIQAALPSMATNEKVDASHDSPGNWLIG
jgi:hypothetical protein